MKTVNLRRLLLNVAPIAASLLCWEALSRAGTLNTTFFPPPSEVVGVTVFLLLEQGFGVHVWTSLRRIALAFLLGGSAGVAVGLLMGWSRDVRLLLDPYVGLVYPIPKIALVPVMFALLGVTEATRVLTMSIAIFLPVAVNTMSGVQQIDETYVDTALDNGADTLSLYRDVLIPGALPQIFTGLSIGAGIGFTLVVVIEMIAADAGLGYVIWQSWRMFTIDRMYAALVVINVFGILFVYGTNVVGERVTFWAGG